MHGFHIALIGVRGRDAHVLAVAERGGEAGGMALVVVVADEFAAVVSLPDQMAQLDAVAFQIPLDSRGERGAGR